MVASDAVNTDVQALTTTSTVSEARALLERLSTRQFPVVDAYSRRLAGQVSSQLLSDQQAHMLDEIELDDPFKVYSNEHLFQAVRVMMEHELDYLPVIDTEWHYAGMLNREDMVNELGRVLHVMEPGAVLTISLNQHDFSLSEIVHLIEAEGGKILGLTVEAPDMEDTSYRISLKLNLQDVSRVASALRRFGYTIHTESESEAYTMDFETRADELLKYIDM